MFYRIFTNKGLQRAEFENNKQAMREIGEFIYNTELDLIKAKNETTGEMVLWII